jgi:hypothetical protein
MANDRPDFMAKDGTVKRSAVERMKNWERMKAREDLADALQAAKASGDQAQLDEASRNYDAWRTMEREITYAQQDAAGGAEDGRATARPETIRATARANKPKE